MRNVITELNGNVFVLFVDTFSISNDFVSKTHSNPSLRITLGEKILFHPIYLLPTWDAYIDYDAIKNIKDTIKIENVCRFGPVLWGNLYDTYSKNRQKYANENIHYYFLADLTITKLIGGNSNTYNYNYTTDE